MIGTAVRSVGAVLAGLLVAAVLIVGVEAFSSIVHQFPPDVDPTDYEVCKAHVSTTVPPTPPMRPAAPVTRMGPPDGLTSAPTSVECWSLIEPPPFS